VRIPPAGESSTGAGRREPGSFRGGEVGSARDMRRSALNTEGGCSGPPYPATIRPGIRETIEERDVGVFRFRVGR